MTDGLLCKPSKPSTCAHARKDILSILRLNDAALQRSPVQAKHSALFNICVYAQVDAQTYMCVCFCSCAHASKDILNILRLNYAAQRSSVALCKQSTARSSTYVCMRTWTLRHIRVCICICAHASKHILSILRLNDAAQRSSIALCNAEYYTQRAYKSASMCRCKQRCVLQIL